jgi:putative acetyltransferase
MIVEKTVFRPAAPEDRLAVLAVQKRAFDRDSEADLVDRLVESPVETISMIAELDGRIVGHVLLSEIDGPKRSLVLAPLGVDPDWRDFLIGTELTRRAIAQARGDGWLSVFVLGDPVYYGRFGFKSEMADPVECAWQGPNFMALELVPGGLARFKGKLRYPDAFDSV